MARLRAPGKLDSLAHQRALKKEHGNNTPAYWRAIRRALDNREVSPASLVGGGYKDGRKVAEKYVNGMLADAIAKEASMPQSKSKSSAAATRARRAKLAEKPVEYLQNIAADLDIPGRSGMNKQALVKAIDLAQSGKAPKRKPTQKARQKAAAAKKREASVGHGRGPFRLVIAKDDAIYGNLGPYASARAALADAKTLLRRMAPVKGYALSNTEAQSFVGQSYAGGTIVDGYVVQSKGGTDLNAAAFAVKVGKTSKAAYAADKIPPKLRNNGRRNARGSAADPVAVRELVLSTENDGDVYRQVTTPAIANLARKLAKGQFDRAKAVKMMGYVADAGARKYGWEHVGPRRGSWMGYSLTKAPFTAADRRAAAADLLDAYMEQIESEAASMGGSRRNAGRRNPRVSFQTKDGPVSFMAKKKRNAGYSDRNPKIDFYYPDGSYAASSRWYSTLREARVEAKRKYGKDFTVEFDRDFNDRHGLRGGTPRRR